MTEKQKTVNFEEFKKAPNASIVTEQVTEYIDVDFDDSYGDLKIRKDDF